MEASQVVTPDKTIRKLRKKLRQIDHLQLLDRDLNEEELQKVSRKGSLRKELRSLLQEHYPDEVDIMKRQGDFLIQKQSDVKKVKNLDSLDVHQSDPNVPAANTDTSQPPGMSEKSQASKSDVAISRSSRASTHTAAEADVYTPVHEEPKTQVKSETPKKSSKGLQPSHTNTREKCVWRDSCYEVLTLQGHNDIILDVDCMDDYILSASRDTTVRVWRVKSVEEERSLRGHTAAVTAVAFLPGPLAASVWAKFETDSLEYPLHEGRASADCQVLGVSGGLDCMLKVWNVTTGESLGSIYTYNGITSLKCGRWGVVTGTEGGRLEFWCVVTGQRITFIDCFESQVITIHVSGDDVYAGSVDGELGLWRLDPTSRTLATQYTMEAESSTHISLRHFSALVEHKDKCYLGDGGPNIKVLDWRKGQVSRLRNHIGDIGMTDSLALTEDGCLLAASFFVDSGCPSINIRQLQGGRYLCSLIDKDEGRYLAMSTAPGVIVTGGHLLKVWLQKEKSFPLRKDSKNEVIQPITLRKLSSAAIDSGSEEDTDWASSSEDEEDRQQLMAGREVDNEEGLENGRWWCSIL